MFFKNQKCHNRREDIVVPYVTTYAVPLQRVHMLIQLYRLAHAVRSGDRFFRRTKQKSLISSRDEMKRCIAAKSENWGNILKNTSCENLFGIFGSIFYRFSVVGGVVNCIGLIYGGTLPVLKNEIGDFFFARLGTGRTYRFSLRHNVCRPATTRLHIQLMIFLFQKFSHSPTPLHSFML